MVSWPALVTQGGTALDPERLRADQRGERGCRQARIQAHINAKVQPLADEFRTIEVDRLDRYLAKLDTQITPKRAPAVLCATSKSR